MSVNFWVQLGQELYGEGIEDWSGFSVSMNEDGSRVAVGAPLNDGPAGSNSGHVRVFEYKPNLTPPRWEQLGFDINGDEAGDNFGRAVALSCDGKRVVVGAPRDDVSPAVDIGYARVYEYNGFLWVPVGDKIPGEASMDLSGSSVSINRNGSIIAVGSPCNDSPVTDAGKVVVYKYDGANWVPLGSEITGFGNGDKGGTSVSLNEDGDIVAIGAPLNDESPNFDRGCVRVFKYDGSNWNPLGQSLYGNNKDFFGSSVSLNSAGDYLAVGATESDSSPSLQGEGYARIFRFNGAAWVQVGSDINGDNKGDLTGANVSLSGDGMRVAVSCTNANDSPLASPPLNGAGLVRVYRYFGGDWVLIPNQIEGCNLDDMSGTGLAMSKNGKRVAVGSPFNDNNSSLSSNIGKVIVYQFTDTEKPVITLIGDSEVCIDLLDTYVDSGATAFDSFDGDLTSDIVVTSNVDTDHIGEYTVTYDVEDSCGLKADQVTRTVIVSSRKRSILIGFAVIGTLNLLAMMLGLLGINLDFWGGNGSFIFNFIISLVSILNYLLLLVL